MIPKNFAIILRRGPFVDFLMGLLVAPIKTFVIWSGCNSQIPLRSLMLRCLELKSDISGSFSTRDVQASNFRLTESMVIYFMLSREGPNPPPNPSLIGTDGPPFKNSITVLKNEDLAMELGMSVFGLPKAIL